MILSLIINILFLYCIFNILRKYEAFEKLYDDLLGKYETSVDFYETLYTDLNTTIDQMKQIDLRGSFEADDEVGSIFKDLYGLVTSLEVYLKNEVKEEDNV